jgi:hypothetical protein
MDEKEAARAMELAKWFERAPAEKLTSSSMDDRALIARALRALIKRDESVW